MSDKNRFFSSNSNNTGDTPFGLSLKETMAPPSLNKGDMTVSGGASPPTQTPRGFDNGTCDVDVDF